MVAGETLAVVGKKIIPAATGESSTVHVDHDRALMGGVDLRRPQIWAKAVLTALWLAATRCGRNVSSSEFPRFCPSVLKCAEPWFGHTGPYCGACEFPSTVGLTSGMKRLGPAVEPP